MKFKMSNEVYDVLAFVTRYVLPAVGTLYFAVAKIWNLPYIGEICGTIAAVETFLASVLGISTAQWTADKALSDYCDGDDEETTITYTPFNKEN